jgi:dihydrofolate reductase
MVEVDTVQRVWQFMFTSPIILGRAMFQSWPCTSSVSVFHMFKMRSMEQTESLHTNLRVPCAMEAAYQRMNCRPVVKCLPDSFFDNKNY